MRARKLFVIVFLVCSAFLLSAQDEPPLEPPPECSPECLEKLDPYFRNALWYYENYHIEKREKEVMVQEWNDQEAEYRKSIRRQGLLIVVLIAVSVACAGVTIYEVASSAPVGK